MVAHLSEIRTTNEFKKFDYGSEAENNAHYGQSKPPMIPLKNIPSSVPISMIVCREDEFSTPIDAIKAMGEIGEAVISYREREQCDHCSFNTGADMSYIDDILDLVNNVNDWTTESRFF